MSTSVPPPSLPDEDYRKRREFLPAEQRPTDPPPYYIDDGSASEDGAPIDDDGWPLRITPLPPSPQRSEIPSKGLPAHAEDRPRHSASEVVNLFLDANVKLPAERGSMSAARLSGFGCLVAACFYAYLVIVLAVWWYDAL